MTRNDVTPHERRYGEHRPYPDAPARLADLNGPITGTLTLPVTIDWGPKRVYDMSKDNDRRVVYELVLQEASSAEEVSRYVNGSILVQVWPRLFLPRRVRSRWEGRFPDLVGAA